DVGILNDTDGGGAAVQCRGRRKVIDLREIARADGVAGLGAATSAACEREQRFYFASFLVAAKGAKFVGVGFGAEVVQGNDARDYGGERGGNLGVRDGGHVHVAAHHEVMDFGVEGVPDLA